jgi:hypothetical protein
VKVKMNPQGMTPFECFRVQGVAWFRGIWEHEEADLIKSKNVRLYMYEDLEDARRTIVEMGRIVVASG